MEIKNLGPLLAFLSFILVAASADLMVQQSKPHNQNKPAETEHRDISKSETFAASASNENNNGSQKKGDGDGFFDKPTDWLLTIFTFFLVLYTRRLYQATAGLFVETAGLRKAADEQRSDMLRTIEAAEKSADAAKVSAEIARDTLMSQRATIAFVEWGIDFGMPLPPNNYVSGVQFKPRWVNNGGTYAINCRAWTEIRIASTDAEANEVFFKRTNLPAIAAIGPKISVGGAPVAIVFEEIFKAWQGKTRLILWAICEYNDTFPNSVMHYTEVCMEILINMDPRIRCEIGAPAPNLFTMRVFGKQNTAS